jgi:hypothetical protein
MKKQEETSASRSALEQFNKLPRKRQLQFVLKHLPDLLSKQQ